MHTLVDEIKKQFAWFDLFVDANMCSYFEHFVISLLVDKAMLSIIVTPQYPLEEFFSKAL